MEILPKCISHEKKYYVYDTFGVIYECERGRGREKKYCQNGYSQNEYMYITDKIQSFNANISHFITLDS